MSNFLTGLRSTDPPGAEWEYTTEAGAIIHHHPTLPLCVVECTRGDFWHAEDIWDAQVLASSLCGFYRDDRRKRHRG